MNLTPPSTSHTEGRNTTGTSGDLQSAEYYPKLIGSHLLTNRLSVTSWHSLASSWHTNMTYSKDSLKRASKGPNYFSSVNYVTFYRPELHILPIQLHLIQNRHDSTSIYAALTHPQTHTPTQYTHTQPVLHPSVLFPAPLRCFCLTLSWRAADGTGSLLLYFIEHYLFYSFCSTYALLQTASLTASS